MDKRNQIIKQVANEVVTSEKIISYLDIVKNNINLSVLNQCMIYLQNPEAKLVCGRQAWKTLNRTPKENAKPIVLYIPNIIMVEPPEEFKIDGIPQAIGSNDISIYFKEAIYSNNYIPVNVFDYDNTEGDTFQINEKLPTSFMDTIIDITQVVPEFVDNLQLNGALGIYNKEENMFYISNKYSNTPDNEKLYEILLSIYVDYVLCNYNISDVVLGNAIKYILYNRYNIKTHNIEKPLFKRLNNLDIDKKISFITLLQWLLNGIVQDIEGYYLNFDETALINDLLLSKQYSDMWIAFDKAASSIDDEMLKSEMKILKNKLMRTTDGYLDDLLDKKLGKKLFSFPPTDVVLDDIDYIRKQRLNFLELSQYL